MILVVMGVAGAGKSAVGRAAAERLGAEFVEGDDLHPPEHIARMAAGVPLTDADRDPWIGAIADRIRRVDRASGDAVIACSALRRAHRDRLRAAAGDLRFAWLDASPGVIRARLDRRSAETGHFMGAGMLDGQLAALERPGADEPVRRIDVSGPVEGAIDAVVSLGRGG